MILPAGGMSWRWLMVALAVSGAACVGTRPLEGGLGCPCAPGWFCNEAMNACVPEGIPDESTPPGQMVDRTPNPLPKKWPPHPLDQPSLAYDLARARLVLLTNGTPVQPLGPLPRFSVWEWDGTSWADRSDPGAAHWPPSLVVASAAYDPDRRVTVFFGGYTPGGYDPGMTTLGDQIWEWNGATFSNPQATPRPLGRNSHAMVYDPVRRVTLLFGGWSYDGIRGQAHNDLWQWDGTRWTDLTPSPLPTAWPGPRSSSTLVWDSRRQRAVLFGGVAVNPLGSERYATAELWEWDGAGWTNLTPDPLPDGWPLKRSGHAAVYDPIRGVMLVFSGTAEDRRAPATSSTRDLWEWQPSRRAFRNLTPTVLPRGWPPSSGWAGGAYDAARGVVTLLGPSIAGAADMPYEYRFIYEYGP
jgi:hypothetical protein